MRLGSLALLWLWCRLAAVARIPSLAWELPYTASVALKKKKKIQYSTIVYKILEWCTILENVKNW